MKRLFVLLTLVSMVAPNLYAQSHPVLDPAGFGKQSYASWKSGEGLPDSVGKASFGLYMQKMVPLETYAAAVVILKGDGIDTVPVTAYYGGALSWQRKVGGYCSGGAPRFNMTITRPSGESCLLFLGCANATSSTSGDWSTEVFNVEDTLLNKQYGYCSNGSNIASAADGTVTGLAIVLDEGFSDVTLDNIHVKTTGTGGVDQTWTSPADNGN